MSFLFLLHLELGLQPEWGLGNISRTLKEGVTESLSLLNISETKIPRQDYDWNTRSESKRQKHFEDTDKSLDLVLCKDLLTFYLDAHAIIMIMQ